MKIVGWPTFVAWRIRANAESTPGPKYCDRCGASNPPTASTCSGCGQWLPY